MKKTTVAAKSYPPPQAPLATLTSEPPAKESSPRWMEMFEADRVSENRVYCFKHKYADCHSEFASELTMTNNEADLNGE